MPLLTFPIALIGLVGLPTVAAIYYLRNRFRRHPVSSLMLWVDQRAPREGGARLQKLQTPLLFFLEVAAILLFTLAATGPRMLTSTSNSPLMFVLDDSLSMRATGGGESARARAIEKVMAILARERRFEATFITAGQQPQTLGSVKSKRQAKQLLAEWRCEAPTDCLGEAVTFAAEQGGPRARLVVVSDRPAGDELGGGGIRWHAVGKPAGNIAIVNALRGDSPSGERYMIELANLSNKPADTVLTVTDEGAGQPRVREALEFGANQSRRLTFSLEDNAPALRVAISDDALSADNEAVLLPPDRTKVRVQTRITDDRLRSDVVRAIDATGRAERVSQGGHLRITDDADVTVAPRNTWPVHLMRGEQPKAYVGPFVVDKAHPLGDGLSLVGVVWSAADIDLPGAPLVLAGNRVLVSDTRRPSGHHELRIAINAEASTLTRSLNWPILFDNLVRWRADESPGVRTPNVRLGTNAYVTVNDEADRVTITDPTGERYEQPVTQRRLTIPAERAGLWRVTAGEQTYKFAVNALARGESDLRQLRTDTAGNWLADTDVRKQYAEAAWLPILLAMGVLTAHLMLIARSSRGSAGVRT